MVHEHAWHGFWLFPMFFFILMIIFMFSYRRGCRMPWWYPDRHFHEDRGSDTALDILKKRYARGEINKEKYEEMKKDILMTSDTEKPSEE